jgi:hypothetical protein
MVVGASLHMPAHALCRMLYVLNVSAKCGIMVGASSVAHFVQASCVKMISLNIRLLVRSWNQKILNVSDWLIHCEEKNGTLGPSYNVNIRVCITVWHCNENLS